jgi:hypothetical protein
MNRPLLAACAATVALVAAVAFYLSSTRHAGQEAAAVGPARPASQALPAKPEPPPQRVETPAGVAPLEPQDVAAALADLIGRKAVELFLSTGDFPRRLVATVDNLGRAHAPAIAWPVNTTAGRFTVQEADGGPVIAPDNSSRYTPLVLLVETVDIGKAVDLYVRMYPMLQREYEQLGYPGRYFNDRLVAVIGLLLATPEAADPIRLQLTQVRGTVPSLRPWVRYEFADPALESLAAGQKILLRAGEVNRRRLKARLAEFRQELARRMTPR